MDSNTLRNQSVKIFGCGNTAKSFLQKFSGDIKLEGFISNNPKETIFETADKASYRVERPTVKEQENAFIIVCSVDYQNIAEQLMMLGYRPMVDFMDCEMAEYILTDKKIIFLYGFCHLRAIKDDLENSFCLKKNYVLFYMPSYLALNAYDIGRMNFLARTCDVFVYGMAVTPDNIRKNEALLAGLKKGALKLCLPTVYFGGYFPQKNRRYNAMNKYAVKCAGKDFTPFSYEDSWLNECIENEMSAEAVIEKMKKGIINDKDFILRNLETEWKRLLFVEAQSDFQITDYLKSNFQKKRLFRNEAHMENCVVREYVIQILKRLNVSEELPLVLSPLLNCSQHIIFPETADILNLSWDVEKEVLDLYTYNGWKKVDFEEYIKTYMDTCATIRKLKQAYLLP